MRIAVNTRFLIKDKLEGIGWFTYETMKRLTRNHPEHEFIFLFDRDPDPEFIFSDNVTAVKVWPPARHPYLWKYWFDQALPRVFRKYKPDVFISTDGFLSLNAHVPTLLVIHDLGFEHYPEHTPGIVSRYYRRFTPMYARKANGIVTVSEFSKQDIIHQYRVAPEKITVAHNGAHEQYVPVGDNVKKEVLIKYTGGLPYFLYVGSVHPRKNVQNLLLAYDALRKENTCDHKLLIVGRMAWKTEETQQIYENLAFKQDVIFAGHLQLTELTRVMGAADAFVYPSLFEGFGIPVVEARYCGVPVISSNASSLPEVAGKNAIYFDPNNIDQMRDAMQHFLANRQHYIQLAENDMTARENFNWDNSAEIIYQAMLQCSPKQSVHQHKVDRA